MSLVEHREEGIPRIRWVRADAIGIEEETLTASFLLAPGGIQRDWAPRRVEDLDDAAASAILALAPELVLLGSGPRQRFPAPAFQVGFQRRGIGLETMDNAAAARTFALLAQEGRRVIAAFLLPGL